MAMKHKPHPSHPIVDHRGTYYTLSIIGVVAVALYLIFRFRAHLPSSTSILNRLPASISSRLRRYAPLSTFEDAAENGFSTANFDLSGNMAGDSRAGLDERTLTEVRRIMEELSVGFDEARATHTTRMFRKNGIGVWRILLDMIAEHKLMFPSFADANGYPIDPKAITRLS